MFPQHFQVPNRAIHVLCIVCHVAAASCSVRPRRPVLVLVPVAVVAEGLGIIAVWEAGVGSVGAEISLVRWGARIAGSKGPMKGKQSEAEHYQHTSHPTLPPLLLNSTSAHPTQFPPFPGKGRPHAIPCLAAPLPSVPPPQRSTSQA